MWLRRHAGKSWRGAWRELAAKRIWTARSTQVDLLFTLLYVFGMRIPVAAAEAGSFYGTLRCVGPWLSGLVPAGLTVTAAPATEALLATLVTMLAIDFSSYLMHRAMHEWSGFGSMLWQVHTLHHSARTLTPLTTYRQHPLEPILLNGARGCASALGLGALHAFFINQTPVITVMGLGAGFFLYMFTTNLHHCSVPVRYPRWLRTILVSPHQHQLHHSSAEHHHGCNYGVVFSLWDRLFGTYLDAEPKLGELRFGLGTEQSVTPSVGAMLCLPFTSLLAKRRRLPGAGAAGTLL